MMVCQPCGARQRKIWLLSTGTVLAIVGVALILAWPCVSNKIINLSLPLGPTSKSYEKWRMAPVPIFTSFYLYNWTNPQRVHDPRVKPHFAEMGPYTFREARLKEDVVWHKGNSSVTFHDQRTWYFDAERSGGSLDDPITTPHFPTVSASKLSRHWPKIVRKVVNFTLNREGGGLTLTSTALEWIFKGFYLDIFDFAERLHSPLIPVYRNEFAWLHRRNNSKEAKGNFTIHTGKADLSQMGNLRLWNGRTHSGYWEGECGRINGSTGDLWTPRKQWHETISLFIVDIGRYINLYPQRNVSFRGVSAWLYTSTNETFDSGHFAADTKCFCVRRHECPGRGVIDFSPVAYGGPFFISHPHFYMADALYLENTTGLAPDPLKHGITVLMEPTLGIPLEVNGQILVSLLVERDDDIDYLQNVSHKFYAPIFVAQSKAEIDDELLNFVKLVLMVPRFGLYIGGGLGVVGLLTIAVGVWSATKTETETETKTQK